MQVGFAVCGGNHGIAQAASHYFRGGPSEGQLGLGIPSRDGAVRVHADKSVVSGLEDHAVALALLPQQVRVVLQGRDVPGDAGDTGNLPATVIHRNFGCGHPTQASLSFLELLDLIGLGPARAQYFPLLKTPAESIFAFEIVRVGPPNALLRVFHSESSRVRLVYFGKARIAILEIDQVRNIFH